MAGTIYGGMTLNGIDIEDMADDFHNFGYYDPRFKGYFVKLTQALETPGNFDTRKPAIAIFSDDEPHVPIYAKILDGSFSKYQNDWGCPTEDFTRETFDFFDNLCMEDLNPGGYETADESVKQMFPDCATLPRGEWSKHGHIITTTENDKVEIGLYRAGETGDPNTDGTLTLQILINDDVILCQQVSRRKERA